METKLRAYLIPNILAMVGTSCYVLADTFFISIAAGSDGITALNLVLPLYGLIYALGAMVGVGCATRYSLKQAVQAHDAEDYPCHAVAASLLISSFFVLSGIAFPDCVLRLLGADAQILAVGLPYIRIILCFAPFFLLNYTFTAFTRNHGAPKVAMAATLTSGIFNIIFDYVLMFPFGMGMAGAALATGISPIVSIAICALSDLPWWRNMLIRRWRPSLRKLTSACTLGIVACVGELSNGITTMVFNFILLDLAGNVAVAAYGIIANLAFVGAALFQGVSQGLQPLASRMHGMGRSEEERRIYHDSLKVGGVLAVTLFVGVLLCADPLVALFNREQSAQLAAYAQSGIRLYFSGFLLAFFNMIRSGFLSATERGLEASVIALSRGVLAIVVFAFLLSRVFGVTGIWLSFLCSEAATLLLSLCMAALRKRRC